MRKVLIILRILLMLLVFLNGVFNTFAQATCEYKVAIEIQIDVDTDLEEEIKNTGNLDKDDQTVSSTFITLEKILVKNSFKSGFSTYPRYSFKVATPPPEF